MTTERSNVMSADEAFSRLPPEMPTTFDRMLEAARAEASRIEHSQAARIVGGDLTEPWPCQMKLRDDFLGIVRLIQQVKNDPVTLDRLAPPKKQAGK
jgi:hypothetical protein